MVCYWLWGFGWGSFPSFVGFACVFRGGFSLCFALFVCEFVALFGYLWDYGWLGLWVWIVSWFIWVGCWGLFCLIVGCWFGNLLCTWFCLVVYCVVCSGFSVVCFAFVGGFAFSLWVCLIAWFDCGLIWFIYLFSRWF